MDGMVRSGTLPHSLLLVGPEGTGKELTAIRLAARLNCAGDDEEARTRCASCAKIARLEHPDLHLIHPVPAGDWEKSLPLVIESRREDFYSYGEFGSRARSIGINIVRHVIEAVSKLPFEGRRTVVIFFEAHLMTLEAQNALLKLLEEPPPSAVLVLVTEFADRLVQTILSRCAEIRFDMLQAETVRSFLEDFYSVEPEEAQRLSLEAEGNLRRGILLIDDHFQGIRSDAAALVRLMVDRKAKAMLMESQALADRYTREEVAEILKESTGILRRLMRRTTGTCTEQERDLVDETLGAERVIAAQDFDVPAAIRKIHGASMSLRRNADIELTLSQLLLDLVGKWY